MSITVSNTPPCSILVRRFSQAASQWPEPSKHDTNAAESTPAISPKMQGARMLAQGRDLSQPGQWGCSREKPVNGGRKESRVSLQEPKKESIWGVKGQERPLDDRLGLEWLGRTLLDDYAAQAGCGDSGYIMGCGWKSSVKSKQSWFICVHSRLMLKQTYKQNYFHHFFFPK